MKINGTESNELTLQNGVKKKLTFKYNVDITTAAFEFVLEDYEGNIEVSDTNLDISEIDDYKVSYTLDTSTLSNRRYKIKLKTYFDDGTIDITTPIGLTINS